MSQYIGRRIIPVHGGVWDGSRNYEELTIVLYEASGDSYISRRPVPAGTVIGDKNYWMLYSLYSAQIYEAERHLAEATEDVKKRIAASEEKVAGELEATESSVEKRVSAAEQVTNTNKFELNTRMDGIEKRLDANVTASTEKNADYAAEVVDARVDDDENIYPSLGAHMRALNRGEAIQNLNANKVNLPDMTLAKISGLIGEKANTSFEFSYDPKTDTLRLACVKDYTGDYIVYVPMMSPRDYASLSKLGNRLLIRYKTTNVVNDSGAFKFGMWLGKRNHPDEISGGIFASTYIHTFKNGGENYHEAVNIAAPDSLVYDSDQECYLKDEKPVALQLLLYANSPKAGEEITISGFGSMVVGLGRNSLVAAFGANMIRADVLALSKRIETDEAEEAKRDTVIAANDHMDAQIFDFDPEGVFAPSHSIYEKLKDEYGDQSYKMTFVDNNPMYQMRLDSFLPDSCREVIVEITARRLSESGKLRVQLYDSSCGLNHVPGPMTFEITSAYRRYQFRIGRQNSGNTALGIGPDRTEGTTVQFKNVKVIIPNEQSKQMAVPLRYFCGYPDEVDFSELEAVYLDNPQIVGTDNLALKDGLYLDMVEIYSNKQTDVTFYVGCVDQYGLFQEVSRHTAPIRAGRNLLKFDDKMISVPYGNGIFVQWKADIAVYCNDQVWGYKNLVSTKSHYYDKNGYSGYPLTESKYMIPMRYTLMEESLPVKLERFRSDLAKCNEQGEKLMSRVQNLEASIQNGKIRTNVAMVSPDGLKFYLSIDADGGITTIRSVPNKVAVFGNSLTLGFGTFGMAASDSKHDYFHYVREYLLKMNPDLEMTRYGASTWESMTDSESRKEAVNGFIRNLSGKEDLLIIQLSDNVNTAGKKETFPEDTWTMLSMFRGACPQARILWVASWYGWSANYGPIENACAELGIDLVDIRDLSQLAENQNKIGNTYTDDSGVAHEISSAGVASHPGDIGMKRIADRIIDCLEQYL